MSDVAQRAFDVTALRHRASIGMLAVISHLSDRRTYINKDPQAGQVDTWAYTPFNAGDVIGGDFVLPGGYTIEIRHTVIADDTGVTGAMTAVLALITDNPTLNSLFTATQAVGVLTFTGKGPRVSWTSANAQTSTTQVAVSAATLAAAIPVGRGVQLGNTPVDGVLACTLPNAAALGFQTIDHVITYDAAVDISLFVEILTGEWAGTIVSGTHTMATNIATSMAALVAQLEAALPAVSFKATVSDSGGGDDGVLLTSEGAGLITGRSWVLFGPGRDTGAAAITTGQAITVLDFFGGVAVRSYDDAPDTYSPVVESYAPNAGVKAIRKGLVWVEAPSGYGGGVSGVLLGTASGEEGKFFTQQAAGRIAFPMSKALAIGGDSTVMLLEIKSL